MISAALHPQETQRIDELLRYGAGDTRRNTQSAVH
jgi:hypothetical protein